MSESPPWESLVCCEKIEMSRKNLIAFWQALQEPVSLTVAQLKQARVMSDEPQESSERGT